MFVPNSLLYNLRLCPLVPHAVGRPCKQYVRINISEAFLNLIHLKLNSHTEEEMTVTLIYIVHFKTVGFGTWRTLFTITEYRIVQNFDGGKV